MKRSISGIIRSELAVIENLQFNGYDLGAILAYLQEKHEMFELSLNTFIVSLYRARKKHLKLGIETKELAKEINLNLEIPKKSLKKIVANHHKKNHDENQKTNDHLEFINSTQTSMQNQSQLNPVHQNHQDQTHPDLINDVNEAKNAREARHINQPKLLIKQVRDIFKSKTDISDLL
jgi:hypothetical protein